MEKIKFRNCLGCEAKVKFLWAIFNELKTGETVWIEKKLGDIMEEALIGNLLDSGQFQSLKNVAKDLIPISMEEKNPEKMNLILEFRNEVLEILAAE